MNKMKILILLLAAAMLTGCSSYQYTARQSDIRRNAIRQGDQVTDLSVDYSSQISASSDYQSSKREAIAEAEYRCLEKSKADVVVDPVYKIEYNGGRMRNRYRATVTGYGGRYSGMTSAIDASKKYTREEIENYKLLTDPEFAQYLYARPEGDKYFIHSNDALKPAESAPQSVMLRAPKERSPKKVKQYDYHKSMQLRNAGIGLLCAGVALAGGGAGMALGGSQLNGRGYAIASQGSSLENEGRWENNETKISQGRAMREEGEKLSSRANIMSICGSVAVIVGGDMFIAGIPMIAVGAVRVSKARKMDLTFNAGGNGVGVGLTF